MNRPQRVLVIGLDGGTFDVILPMVERGRLPNFSKLLQEGAWGSLQSTFPPVTPPAWSSFMTGKNPGKHGVFDFYGPPSLGYERPVLNAQSIRTQTLWGLLSEQGKDVGVINVPITHPPEKVKGFIVPGMQYSLETEGGFTYPPELLEEITHKIGEYRVAFGDERSLYTDDLDDFIAQWNEIHRILTETTLYLMESRPWDFFMVVFYSTDAIQHHFWKFHDEAHPLHDPKLRARYGRILEDHYEKIDHTIGEILARQDDRTTLCVLSDHGFGPERKAFFLNRWLINEGLLTVKRRFSPLVRFRFPHIVYKVLQRLGTRAISWTIPWCLHRLLKDRVDPRDGLRISHVIDWTKTKAFAGNHTEQGIYLNVKGREPAGIVDPDGEYEELRNGIIHRLSRVVDPETGEAVVDRVFKREELYHGPYTQEAADLFLVIKEGSYIAQKELHHPELFRLPDKSSGTHRANGLLIIKGDGAKAGARLEGARIIDVAPTILYAMGLPVPEDMDGRALLEAFESGFTGTHPIQYAPAAPTKASGERGLYDATEGEKVREALRGLGYMG